MPEDITHHPDHAELRALEAEFNDRPDHAEPGSKSGFDFDTAKEDALQLVNSSKESEEDWRTGDIVRLDQRAMEWYEDCIHRRAAGEQLTTDEQATIKKILESFRDNEAYDINCTRDSLHKLFLAYQKMMEADPGEVELDDFDVLYELNFFPREILNEMFDDELNKSERPLHNILSQVNASSKLRRRVAMMVANKCYDGQLLLKNIEKQVDLSSVKHIVDSYKSPALAVLDLMPSSECAYDKKEAQSRVAI